MGCGIDRTGVLSSSLGTSGVLFAFASEPFHDEEGRLHSFCHAIPGTWHLMGVMLSAGGALQWFRNAFCGDLVEKAKATGRDVYESIMEEAATVPIGAEGLTFLPYLSGERTPHCDPDARGAFIGLSVRHTRAHLARAVIEGVTFGLRDTLEIMMALGLPISRIRASGGGARSPFWRQMQADVFGLPVVRTNVEEGPAYGAALLATVAAGSFESVEEACGACIRECDAHEPFRQRCEDYEASYRLFQSAYPALKKQFAAHAKRNPDME